MISDDVRERRGPVWTEPGENILEKENPLLSSSELLLPPPTKRLHYSQTQIAEISASGFVGFGSYCRAVVSPAKNRWFIEGFRAEQHCVSDL
jgi:hypothetical protein